MTEPAEILSQLRADGLLRTLRPLETAPGVRVGRGGRSLLNFASNDYLGLAGHPVLAAALIEGVRRYGAGSTASRLVCGTQPPHALLEERLADAKQSGAALAFSSGFATAVGTIPAVVGKGDFVVLDKLSHACLVDGARLSGATLRVFPHNDAGKLDRLLASIRAKDAKARVLVVTESVFSMDGDVCPLREIVGLTERHGALLLVDEAHAAGALGATGMGLAEAEGLQGRVTFQMGTFSKAFGLSGGYLAASRDWIDLLVNRARSFVFSTAPPPAVAYAAAAALDLVRSADGARLRGDLSDRIALFRRESGGGSASATAIQPIVLGRSEDALAASAALEALGMLVPAIRYPTVPRGKARLRVSLSAAHDPDDVKQLAREIRMLHDSPAPPP
ncbi:MAG: 8-amino-7-oxononanoate synthase [Verrucomicrobia bacterium]|nr:8-amino-7-oxononanoate synthase [Verrucomicrobiota bacterium]